MNKRELSTGPIGLNNAIRALFASGQRIEEYRRLVADIEHQPIAKRISALSPAIKLGFDFDVKEARQLSDSLKSK